MPKPKPVVSDDALRNSRFTYAKRRVQAIADGLPPLSQEQRATLAAILLPYAQDDPAGKVAS